MALLETERLAEQVQAFHAQLRGHRRASFWPDAPKEQVTLAVCDLPKTHVFDTQEIKLKGRGYDLAVSVCQHCPLAFATPILKEKKEKV